MSDKPASAAAVSATPKKQAAKEPRTKPNHPPASEMVLASIKSLKERGGSSLQAIKKYIATTYTVDVEKQSPFIKKYLKNAVDKGVLVQTKGKGASGSFKLNTAKTEGTAKKPKAAVKRKIVSKKLVVEKKPKAEKKSGAETKVAKKPALKKGGTAAAKKRTAKKAVSKSAAKKSVAKRTVKSPAAKPKTPKPKKVRGAKATAKK